MSVLERKHTSISAFIKYHVNQQKGTAIAKIGEGGIQMMITTSILNKSVRINLFLKQKNSKKLKC